MAGNGNRQHGAPNLIKDGKSQRLNQVRLDGSAENSFNERWLQRLLFENPNLLPVDEIEPAFSPLIPVCEELQTPAGPLDILFFNPKGMLTLVECKLWRNPEARREVVGQILDYAKELSKWGYGDLEEAVRKASKNEIPNLFAHANSESEDMEEELFVDTVSRNLKKGRFLVLIVGDGIKESVESISEFLNNYGHLNFTFALIEETVFELPEILGKGFLVHPRIIARTVEIERTIIRLEHESMVSESLALETKSRSAGGTRIKITEEEFYKDLKIADPSAVELLPGFIEKCKDLGFYMKFGDSSLMLHWDNSSDYNFNFATFRKDGKIHTNYFLEKTDRIGHREIGEQYLERLASLIDGEVIKSGNLWVWHVKKNNDLPTISETLKKEEEWLELIQETVERINQVST